MNLTELPIPGLLLLEPKVFGDARGFFVETWQDTRYAQLGIQRPFVQDNLSRSVRGVLRGLHLQHPGAQGKLVHVPYGRVLDVALDVRVGSPTFGRHVAIELSGENQHQLFVPRGCAHGFCVISEWALLSYKCDDVYRPDSELGVQFDDPELAIEWPELDWILSKKDGQNPRLRDIPESSLPRF